MPLKLLAGVAFLVDDLPAYVNSVTCRQVHARSASASLNTPKSGKIHTLEDRLLTSSILNISPTSSRANLSNSGAKSYAE